MTFIITSLYPFIGHNCNIILQYLKPRYLSLYASTSKENLKMVQKYFIYVKKTWLKRGIHFPLCFGSPYNGINESTRLIGKKIIKKCIIISSQLTGRRADNSLVAGEIVSVKHFNYLLDCCCIYIYVLGGKGAKKMQNPDISKPYRDSAPLIFKQYPLLLRFYYNPYLRLVRFIPYQIYT